MQKFRNFISLSLVVLFFTAQSTALHQFSHDDSTVPCKICLVSQHVQALDYTPAAAIELPHAIHVTAVQEISVEYAFAKAEKPTSSHTTRPPPVVTC